MATAKKQSAKPPAKMSAKHRTAAPDKAKAKPVAVPAAPAKQAQPAAQPVPEAALAGAVVQPINKVQPIRADPAPPVASALVSMYGGAGRAIFLRENQQIFLFQQQQNAGGMTSFAVQPEINRFLYPWGISFQIYFTDVNGNPADPGAFEVDFQTSDIDQDKQYCTVRSWTSGLNLNFSGRIEFPVFGAKYIRAFVKTLTNAVYTSLLVSH